MQLAEFATTDCTGLVLAHRQNFVGSSLAKGTVLTDQHVAALIAAGVEKLVCARPDHSDIHEDDAAARLAALLSPKNLDFSMAATGRVNIKVPQQGLIRYDREVIRKINEIDERITFALVQHNQLLTAGQMAATLKIIPFFVPETSMKKIEDLVADSSAFRFHPVRQARVALIQTRIDGQPDRLFAATENVTAARLQVLGCDLVASHICRHTRQEVAELITSCSQTGAEIILVCGGSAIIDRQDELPQAVVMAGGVITQLGLAVDPGNLLMFAEIGKLPVIGMPGCARSPKLNGLDWVLQLILADIEMTRAEFADMAAGGLLMEIASRPLPRAIATRPKQPDRLVGMLLAAGQSRRMGGQNKLLADIAGKPMVRHVAEAMCDAGIDDLTVVIGHQADQVAAALDQLPVNLVFNPQFAAGQGHSVAAGITGLDDSVTDVVIALGDMPLVSVETLRQLIAAHQACTDHQRRITLPSAAGKRGNPVIWGSAFFPELKQLRGDAGGRQVLQDHFAAHNPVESTTSTIFQDIDTPAELQAVASHRAAPGDAKPL
ncbi:molybdopterin-binding/glycosyltransferase family 2 protein [Alphaproteobacteria bacterium]|nr:molybdopterin-binding/glycosyltransferase family 2 protein [Alphaproteobacteria bacterium]